MELMSFAQMAERGKKILEKQGPVTLEEAKEQVERLKKNSAMNHLPIKLKVERQSKFRKFEIFVIDLKDNDLPPLREQWKRILMRNWVEIEGKLWYVHAIEAFALHNDCEHESIGLVVSEKIVP